MTGLAVALVDSLLTAMIRADGDALVMHVGERPIVVSGPRTIDLSAHGMNLSAMVGMLGQLLSAEALAALKDLGAVEHALPSRGGDLFSVVAARSGDDIWIEIRRRRESSLNVAARAAEDAPSASPTAAAEVIETAVAPAPSIADPPEKILAAAVDDQPTIEDVSVAAAEPSAPEPELAALDEVPTSQTGDTAAEVQLDAAASADEVPPNEDEFHPGTSNASAAGYELSSQSATTADGAQHMSAMPPDLASEPDVARQPIPQEHPIEAGRAIGADEESPVESMMPPAGVAAESTLPDEEAAAAALTGVSASNGSTASVLVSAATPVMPMDPVIHAEPRADMAPLSRPAPPPAMPADGPFTENGAAIPDAPMTRTVRIEVPARGGPPSRPAGIDRLLRAADSAGASELFLVSQARPYVRVGGNVRPLHEEAPLLPSDIDAMIADVTPEPSREAVRRGDPAEWLIELADVGRVRCSTFRDHRGPGANFQFAFLRAVTADDLQLSAETRLLATEPAGLILVAGGAGSDASAIVAAFVDLLNRQRADYIISLEPQIRALHVNREALVSQREVGRDAGRAVAAARAALREEPDVLVIEGVATGELAQLAIEAASQDRLVIASLEAPSAVAAVQRLVDLVPAEQRPSARAALARSFRGAVAQLLLRKTTGGRIAARELLSGTRTVARILAEGDLAGLAEPLDAPDARGMAPLADAIVEYVRAGVVDVREAARKAPDVQLLIDRLRAAGVDVGLVET
jgi:twitching motility protein PilT